MKRVSYTPHLELRLRIREIPRDLLRKIYERAEERYLDNATGKFIAVSAAKYKDKLREFAVIYEEEGEEIRIITIHPLKPYQKFSRLQSKRWQKL
jgi:hypothetical protein